MKALKTSELTAIVEEQKAQIAALTEEVAALRGDLGELYARIEAGQAQQPSTPRNNSQAAELAGLAQIIHYGFKLKGKMRRIEARMLPNGKREIQYLAGDNIWVRVPDVWVACAKAKAEAGGGLAGCIAQLKDDLRAQAEDPVV